ncbi:MAG: immunoglobulin domain-containing protein [Haliscomenobacter sp.]|nr:immunoglobulin domain-containing protein [Haliscomenobacter sp.]
MRLYIGDGTRIYQAELDGKNLETFVGTGITAVTAIVVGPDGKIYWTDISGMVNRANADKTGVETWISKPRVNAPGALVYDPNTLRWYIGDGNRILKANSIGDTVEVLIGSGITSVSDLAIGTDKKLYWTDRGSSRVMRANANGTGVEQLLAAPAVSSPEAIAIDQTTASTTMLIASGNKILRAELNGTNAQTLVSLNLNLVSDLAIQPGPLCIPVTILRQPADTAVCEGQNVFFGVQVQGTKPYQYQWRKNGQNISGATADTLRLSFVQLTDAGQYDCVIKNACGSITSRKAELTVYPNPKAEIRTIPQPPEICRGTKLQVEGRISGGTPAYQFRWRGDTVYLNPLNSLITTFQADTFGVFQLMLRATDARGCSGMDTVQITVFDNPKAQPTAAPNAACPNDPVQLQGNPTGGSGQFIRHEWNSANGGSLNASNIVNPVFSASQAGVYNLTYKVTDNRQCEGSGQVAVRVNPKPVITLGSNSPVCVGAGLQLTATVGGGSGNYGYSWAFPDNASSTAQNPLIAPAGVQHSGTYRITVTDLNTGCTATASIDAQVIKVEVQASIGRTVCLGDSLLLTSQASGGTEPYTYSWFQGSISPANQVSNTAFFRLTPTATSFYIVVAQDARMCRDTDTTIVRISDPLVRIIPSKTIVCEGDAVRLTGEATGGVPGYSFRWSHNLGILTTVEDHPKTTTTYGLTVTDFIGCVDSAQVTILVDIPQVQITASRNPVCPDELVTLTARSTAGIGPFTFTWNRGTRITDNGSQIQDRPNAETVYKVTMEDTNGCLATAEFTVRVFDAPLVSAWTDKAICPGEKAVIKTSIKGGTGPFVYQWDPASNDQPNHEVGPLHSNQTYKLTVTDANTCEGYASVLVEVYPEHKVTAASNQPICEGEELKLTAIASGDDSGFDFEWTLPDGSKQQIQNLTISNAQANTHSGAYTIRITGKTTGCKADVKIDVKVYPAPQITINGPKDACEGADISLQANLAQGDPNDYEFKWSTPDGKSIDGQNLPLPKIQLNQAGKYTVTVTLKGSATCQATASHDLKVHPSPRVSLATDKTLPICRNDDVKVTATFTDEKGTPLAVKDVKRYLDGKQITGLRFVDLLGTSELFHLSGDQTDKTKSFRVVATDDIGCEGEASLQITVIGPELKLHLDQTDFCMDATIQATTTYTAGTNPKFSWDGFNIAVSPSAEGSSATLTASTAIALGIVPRVSVTLTDDSNCKASDSKEVHVWRKPDFSIIADPETVCKGQEVKLKTTYLTQHPTQTEFKWSTGSADAEITVPNLQSTTTYNVTVTLVSPAGTRCEGEASKEVQVGDLEVSITKNKNSFCPGVEVQLTGTAKGAKIPNINGIMAKPGLPEK